MNTNTEQRIDWLDDVQPEQSKPEPEQQTVNAATQVPSTGAVWGNIERYQLSKPLELNAATLALIDAEKQWDKLIVNLSESTPVAKEYLIASMFAATAAATFGNCIVDFNGAQIPINLYTAFVGGSGSRKSSALSAMMTPLKDFVFKRNKEIAAENSKTIALIDAQKRQRGRTSSEESINTISQRIAELENQIKPELPSTTTDCTPESLMREMKRCGGRVILASGEGNLLNTIMGKTYSQSGVSNIDVFMQGYDGDSVVKSRVKDDGCFTFDRTSVNIVLAVQPHLISQFVGNDNLTDRGITQRFLLYPCPPMQDNFDAHHLTKRNDELYDKWRVHLQTIAERFSELEKPVQLSVQIESGEMSADYALRNMWNWLVRQQQEYHLDPYLDGWFGKGIGLTVRLSGVIALLRDPMTTTITAWDVTVATNLILDYFAPAARNPNNSTMDCVPKEEQIIYMWFKRRFDEKGDTATRRTIYNSLRQNSLFAGADGKAAFDAALKELARRNIIRQVVPEGNTIKQSQMWQINAAAISGGITTDNK